MKVKELISQLQTLSPKGEMDVEIAVSTPYGGEEYYPISSLFVAEWDEGEIVQTVAIGVYINE